MLLRRVVFVVVTVLAMLLPEVASAQTGIGTSVVLRAPLSGSNEIGTGDPEGFGFAKVRIDLATSQVCYRLSVAGTGAATAAHIHVGNAGTNGPVVVPFAAPVDGLSNGCVGITADLAAAIATNPSGYYVNIHTAEFPGGAVRGQLDWLGGQPNFRFPDATTETVADGLNFPRGLAFGADGAVYVTDSGPAPEPGSDGCVMLPGPDGEDSEACFVQSGSIVEIKDGMQNTVATGLPGSISDLVVTASGEMYVVNGMGGDPTVVREAAGDFAAGYGYIVKVDSDGDGWVPVADIAGYEAVANPDGGMVDTNPFGLALDGDGFLVTDAGGNSLLHASMDGTVSTVAVFSSQMVDAPPFLELPEGTQIPMEAVPTSVTQGPDGAWYVSELTGFPFEVDAARIWRVEDMNADGDALDDGEMSVYAEGFTAALDLAFDPEGQLYVLEMAKNGLLAFEEDPSDLAAGTGALIRINSDGTRTEVASGLLILPIGLAIDSDGVIYATHLSLVPDMGEVVKIVLRQ